MLNILCYLTKCIPANWPSWSGSDPHSIVQKRVTRLPTQNLRGSRSYTFCSGEAFSSDKKTMKIIDRYSWWEGAVNPSQEPNPAVALSLYLRPFGLPAAVVRPLPRPPSLCPPGGDDPLRNFSVLASGC